MFEKSKSKKIEESLESKRFKSEGIQDLKRFKIQKASCSRQTQEPKRLKSQKESRAKETQEPKRFRIQ